MLYVNDELDCKFLYTETIKLYCNKSRYVSMKNKSATLIVPKELNSIYYTLRVMD